MLRDALDEQLRGRADVVPILAGPPWSCRSVGQVEEVWDYEWMAGPGAPEKRSIRGGDLDGVSVSEFVGEDERTVRSEVPEYS